MWQPATTYDVEYVLSPKRPHVVHGIQFGKDGYFLLREPADGEPSCLRLIQALTGVCDAAERVFEGALAASLAV